MNTEFTSPHLSYPCSLTPRHSYVEQSDIHSPRTTVREALAISALLRLPGVSRHVVEVRVVSGPALRVRNHAIA